MLDCLKPISHKRLIEHELEGFGIRLNKQPPAIAFRRKEKGGIAFTTTASNPRLDLDGARPCTGGGGWAASGSPCCLQRRSDAGGGRSQEPAGAQLRQDAPGAGCSCVKAC